MTWVILVAQLVRSVSNYHGINESQVTYIVKGVESRPLIGRSKRGSLTNVHIVSAVKKI